LELPSVTAVDKINETSKVTLELIGKYDSLLKNTDLNILMVDTELSKMLLLQKDDYLILAQEKCLGDSNNKYWESELTFGTKNTKSDQVKKTRNGNPDSSEVLSFMNTITSVLESDPMERIAVLKSNENQRMKFRIALAEYKFQLSSIKKSKFDCNFRRSLFESYFFLIKFYFSLRKNTYD
jgi:hypothetical protein